MVASNDDLAGIASKHLNLFTFTLRACLGLNCEFDLRQSRPITRWHLEQHHRAIRCVLTFSDPSVVFIGFAPFGDRPVAGSVAIKVEGNNLAVFTAAQTNSGAAFGNDLLWRQ